MWAELVSDTFRRPRAAARRLLELPIGGDALAQAALAVVCLGMVLSHLAGAMAGAALDPMTAALLANPLLGALIQLGGLIVAVVLTWQVGRSCGGRGDLNGALRVVVWLNAVLLLLQAAQLVALAVLPPLAMAISFAGMAWLLWAFASFVGELHGFGNTFIVAVVTLVTGLVVVFVLMLLLAMLGLMPQGIH